MLVQQNTMDEQCHRTGARLDVADAARRCLDAAGSECGLVAGHGSAPRKRSGAGIGQRQGALGAADLGKLAATVDGNSDVIERALAFRVGSPLHVSSSNIGPLRSGRRKPQKRRAALSGSLAIWRRRRMKLNELE